MATPARIVRRTGSTPVTRPRIASSTSFTQRTLGEASGLRAADSLSVGGQCAAKCTEAAPPFAGPPRASGRTGPVPPVIDHPDAVQRVERPDLEPVEIGRPAALLDDPDARLRGELEQPPDGHAL